MHVSQSTEHAPVERSLKRTPRSVAAASQSSSSSFVFTSSKVGNIRQSGSRDPSASQQATSTTLSPFQVTIHAYGASHALPESSIFNSRDSNSGPSPIRRIKILPDELPIPSGQQRSQSKSTTARESPKPSINFYLEAVKRATRLQPLLLAPGYSRQHQDQFNSPHTLLLNYSATFPPGTTSSAQSLLSPNESVAANPAAPISSEQSDSDSCDREESAHSDDSYEPARSTTVFR